MARPIDPSKPLQLVRVWPGPRNMPALVAHADWSKDARKRRMAIATRGPDGHYEASATIAAPVPNELFASLRRRVSSEAAVLAGFDFAIGLPSVYAKACGAASFIDFLGSLRSDRWRSFFEIATKSSEIAIERPFYPRACTKKGAATQAHLLAALGVSSMDDLRRACDRAQPARGAAEVLFWTLGARQVGRGVIVGWQDLLIPGSRPRAYHLWPFEGGLAELLEPGRTVVVETYPAEMYGHLGVTAVRKRSQASRKDAGVFLRTWVTAAGIRVDPALDRQLGDGFGPRPDGEDDFDAVVGLFGMLNVVLGFRLPGAESGKGDSVEGWMLGLQ